MGNYIHQMYDQEPPEEVIELDFRFQDLALTPEQIHMARPTLERQKELVQDSLVVQRFRAAAKRDRQRGKNKSRWGQTLAQQKIGKFA